MVTECVKEPSYYQERIDDVIRHERNEKDLLEFVFLCVDATTSQTSLSLVMYWP